MLGMLALAALRDVRKKLFDYAHVRPVILELVSAVQADHIVLTGRSWDVPVRVYGAAFGSNGCGKRLRNLFVRAANREQLENFIDHGRLFYRAHSGVLPAGSTLNRGKWDCHPKRNLCSSSCHARRVSD